MLERVAAPRGGSDAAQQAAGAEPGDQGRDIVVRGAECAGDLTQHRQAELLADDGGDMERVALGPGQVVDTGGQHALHGGGQRALIGRAAAGVGAGSPGEDAVVGQRTDELLGEERVAGALLGDAVPDRVERGGRAQQSVEQVRGVGGAEFGEVDGLGSRQGECLVARARPRVDEEHGLRAHDGAGQRGHERLARRVQPMQVLEQQHHRRAAPPADQPRDDLDQARAPRSGAEKAAHALLVRQGQEVAHQSEVAGGVADRRERVADGLDGAFAGIAGGEAEIGRAQQIRHWLERRRAAIRLRPCLEDRNTGRTAAAGEFMAEAALAGAGRAGHADDGAGPGDRRIQRSPQHAQLARPADERRQRGGPGGAGRRGHALQRIHQQRLRHATERAPSEQRHVAVVADQPITTFRQTDFVRGDLGRQPAGDVQRHAERGRQLVTRGQRGMGDDLAAMQPGAHRQCIPVGFQGGPDGKRGAAGQDGMALERHRSAKHGHDAVAEGGDDRATEAAHGVGHDLQDRLQPVHRRFGVEVGDEPRRVHQIGDHDRHLLELGPARQVHAHARTIRQWR